MSDTVDRRSFARRARAAVGGFFALVFGVPAAATVVDPVLRGTSNEWAAAGHADDVKEGEAKRVVFEVTAGWEKHKEAAFLVRENGKVVALSATCTHLACKVRYKVDQGDGQFHCPCHGAIFQLNGDVAKGPAEKPLTRLEVREQDGVIQVKA